MKKFYLLLVCMICFIHTAYAQTIIDPLTGMTIYSGSSLPYTPVLPPALYIPKADDFIDAGRKAVMRLQEEIKNDEKAFKARFTEEYRKKFKKNPTNQMVEKAYHSHFIVQYGRASYSTTAETNERNSHMTDQERRRVSSGNANRECPECGGSGKCISFSVNPAIRERYCYGTSNCSMCGGDGLRTGYNGITENITCSFCWSQKRGKCAKCKGTGKCNTCKGEGTLR